MDRLIEELYLCLVKCHSYDYQQQAFKLIYKIPVYRPVPKFVIKISDLSEQVKKELDFYMEIQKRTRLHLKGSSIPHICKCK